MLYHDHVKKNDDLPPELELYFLLCTRGYERMECENSWPWENKDEDAVS